MTIEARRLALWRAFLEAHAGLTERMEIDLQRDCDLPLGWYDVMVHLSEADDLRLRMRELADKVLLSRSGLSRLVDRMVEAALVERQPCDDDKRGTWAALTEEGLARLRQAHPSHAATVANTFTDVVTDDEVAPMLAAFDRIRAGLRPNPQS